MDITTFLNNLLQFIPPSYLATTTAIISFVIATCALIMRFWKPPSKESRWITIYHIVSAVGQARGWNASAYQPDRKAIMVPATKARSEIAENLGLDVNQTRP